MRKILICTLLAAAFSAQAQIRTVGITYTAGAPTFTPSTQGSFIAYDTTGRDFYEFFGGVWTKTGQVIDQIAGAVAPAYTPTKMDSRFAINASGELYWHNGVAWLQVNGVTDLTFSGSASPFTLNSSTGTDVTFAQGGIVSLSRNNNQLTISATEVDGSVSNEGVLGVGAGDANTSTITSNTSGATGVTIAGTSAISVTESTSSNGGTITIDVANDGVTFAKMQEISSQHLIGRHSGGSGDIQEVSVGNGVEFQGSGIRRSALTGDVTAAAGSNTTTIANSAVTFAKIQDLTGLSVIGRSASTTGVTAAITAGSDHQVLRRSGSDIGFGAIALGQSNAVTGTLGVANGGTGAATTNAHHVFAGPTSGGAAAPSFRNLDRRDVSGGTSSRIPFYLSDGRLTDTVGFTWNRAVLNIEPSNGTVSTLNTFIRGGNTTTTGTFNTAVGASALLSNTTGGGNTALGTVVLRNNTTGTFNTAVGASALENNRSGGSNTAVGLNTLQNNTTGAQNTAVGINAGNNTTTADTLTGSNNTIIGASAATNIAAAAAGNLVLGNSVNLPTGNGSNQVVIKNAIFATGASATGTTIPADGKVGIMVAAPSAYLHLRAGESAATRAPLKFTSGTNMTTPEAGAMEWNGTNLFLTNSTPTRQTINQGLTGSASLDFGNTNAGESADLTITVTGAADGDVVAIGVPNAAVNANTCYTAWVSAANTVTVRFNNYSGSAVNPASGTFKAFVTKF